MDLKTLQAELRSVIRELSATQYQLDALQQEKALLQAKVEVIDTIGAIVQALTSRRGYANAISPLHQAKGALQRIIQEIEDAQRNEGRQDVSGDQARGAGEGIVQGRSGREGSPYSSEPDGAEPTDGKTPEKEGVIPRERARFPRREEF